MTRWKTVLAPGLLIAAGMVAYGGALTCPFIFDDFPAIVDNPTIRHLGTWRGLLATASAPWSSASGRPLLNLSFAINDAIGGLDVRGYHAVNLAIHVLAALTLFGIVRRTFSSGLFALVVALLWEVHPLLTESVTCVVQRSESLMGLFYLLTVYCFIRYAEMVERVVPNALDEPVRRVGTTRSTPWAILSVTACLLGMATKEVMITAPILVLLYDRLFIAGSFAEAWRRRRKYYVGLAATWLPLACLVVAEGGSRGQAVGLGLKVTPAGYAVTQAWAVAHYLRLAIWPQPLVMDYGVALVGLDRAWPSLLMVGSLVVVAAWALVRACRGRAARPGPPSPTSGPGRAALPRTETLARSATLPALAFAGAWFFVVLAPSSSVVPLAAQTIAEHRMYLPLAAVVALAAGFVWRATGRAGLLAMLTLAVPLLAATVRRNRDYRSDESIWADTVAHRPDNPRARQRLGLAREALGRTDEAIAQYREALRLKPDYAETHYDLGEALARQRRIAEAMAEYRSALRFRPEFPEAHNNLGSLLGNQGRLEEAAAEFAEAVRLKPDYIEARRNLALAAARLNSR